MLSRSETLPGTGKNLNRKGLGIWGFLSQVKVGAPSWGPVVASGLSEEWKTHQELNPPLAVVICLPTSWCAAVAHGSTRQQQ